MRGNEKRYHFQEEAAVGRSFNGLVSVERSGVLNRHVCLSMPHLTHLIIPFSGEIKVAA